MKQKYPEGKDTLILMKRIPQNRVLRKRYFIHGKRLDTTYAISLMEKAGIKVECKMEESRCPAHSFGGIPIGSYHGGLVVWPKKPEDFNELKKLLQKRWYWYRDCKLPK